MSKYSVTCVFVLISIVFCQLLLHINVQIIYCLVNYGVVLLLVVVLKYYTTTKTTIYAARAASPKGPSTTS
jgi:hypothetical protein